MPMIKEVFGNFLNAKFAFENKEFPLFIGNSFIDKDELSKKLYEYRIANGLFYIGEKVVIKDDKFVAFFFKDRNTSQDFVFTVVESSINTMRNNRTGCMIKIAVDGEDYGYVVGSGMRFAAALEIQENKRIKS